MQPRTPVVELLRVSTVEQSGEDRAGIPRQVEANRRTVERCGLHVIETIKLVDVSGASIMYVPEIAVMLTTLRAGRARGIVCADFDRLLRPDDFRSLAILQDIRESGALIYLPDQTIDLNTQSGYLISGLNSIIAGNELAQIKKRMQGAKEEKRRQGKCPQSWIALPTGVGYDRTIERWHYTPESSLVTEIFDLFLAGEHNLRELQRQTGVHHQTIKNLLRNQMFIGVRAYEKKRASERRLRPDGRQADRRKVDRPEAEVIRVQVIDDPLIAPADFWRVQEILAGKRDGYRARRSKGTEVFLLQGLLRCAVCGEPMYTVPGGKAGPQKDYYYCRRKASAYRKTTGGCSSHYMGRQIVEETVLEFIGKRLADEKYLYQQVSRLLTGGDAKRTARAREDILASLNRADQARERNLELYTDGLIDRSELDTKLAKTGRERARLEERLSAIVAPSSMTQVDLADMAGRVAKGFALFQFWDAEAQRKFLRAESPTFWIDDSGITRFALSAGLNKSSPMGRGSWPPRA